MKSLLFFLFFWRWNTQKYHTYVKESCHFKFLILSVKTKLIRTFLHVYFFEFKVRRAQQFLHNFQAKNTFLDNSKNKLWQNWEFYYSVFFVLSPPPPLGRKSRLKKGRELWAWQLTSTKFDQKYQEKIRISKFLCDFVLKPGYKKGGT